MSASRELRKRPNPSSKDLVTRSLKRPRNEEEEEEEEAETLKRLREEKEAEDAGRGQQKRPRYWTDDEHKLFLQGVKMYGLKDDCQIASLVKTRTVRQVATHKQKFLMKNKGNLCVCVCVCVYLRIHIRLLYLRINMLILFNHQNVNGHWKTHTHTNTCTHTHTLKNTTQIQSHTVTDTLFSW